MVRGQDFRSWPAAKQPCSPSFPAPALWLNNTRTCDERKTTTVGEGSGERRLSLYDVLTGEAPLPPPQAEKLDATAAASATITSRGRFHGGRCSGGGGGGGGGENGVGLLGGGARRASIFDRIADVVFNEEQKDLDPVDAFAVRYVRIGLLMSSSSTCGLLSLC